MPKFTQRHIAALTVAVLLLGFGCSTTSRARVPDPDPIQLREIQTRVFDTGDEAFVLAAAVGVLQDLGYNLDESTPALGVLAASKEASIAPPSVGSKVAEGGRAFLGAAIGSIFNGILDAALDTDANSENFHEEWHEDRKEKAEEPYSVKEEFRVSLVTRPQGDGGNSRVTVRIMIGRVVWNNVGRESLVHMLKQADLYDEFFAKLGQAVFLEAHQV